MSAPEQSLTMQIMSLKDIGVLKFIVGAKEIDDSIFGFHAQQSVEKSDCIRSDDNLGVYPVGRWHGRP
ncbi:MAG: hypothetical protein WA140_00365 [Geobacteraceae bacterium]